MSHVHSFTFNAFSENTYVISDPDGSALLIDPGCFDPWEQERVADYIATNKLTLKKILLTHGHIDHVLGLHWAKDKYGLTAALHPYDQVTLNAVSAYAPNYGFVNYQHAPAEDSLAEKQIIRFGKTLLEVLFVPGHSAGHVAFLNRAEKYIIAGDVLFKGSVGRWDLPGGLKEQLIESIKTKLYSLIPDLGPDVVVYPGHGPATTLGAEQSNNPFTK